MKTKPNLFFMAASLVLVSCAILVGSFSAISRGILENFSARQVQNDLITAARLTEYENARFGRSAPPGSTLFYAQQAEKLAFQQRETLKEILSAVKRQLAPKLILLIAALLFTAGFFSRKTDASLDRFRKALEEIQAEDEKSSKVKKPSQHAPSE